MAADFISLGFLILWIGVATGVILAAVVLLLTRGAAAAEPDAHREAVLAHQLATRYSNLVEMERAPIRWGEARQRPLALAARSADATSYDEMLGKLRGAAAERGIPLLAGAAFLAGGFLLLHFRRRRVSRARISLWTYPTYPDPDVPIGMESALPAMLRQRPSSDPGANERLN